MKASFQSFNLSNNWLGRGCCLRKYSSVNQAMQIVSMRDSQGFSAVSPSMLVTCDLERGKSADHHSHDRYKHEAHRDDGDNLCGSTRFRFLHQVPHTLLVPGTFPLTKILLKKLEI